MRRTLLGAGAFAALAISVTTYSAFAMDVDPALKEMALSLNTISDDKAAEKKLRELFRDKPGTKKLVEAALEMQKEGGKKSPLKMNATIILAKAAHGVKEFLAAETFYESTIEQAARLQVDKKLAQAGAGMIQVQFAQKEYAKAENWCQKFMDFGDGREVRQYQAQILEWQILAIAKQGEIDKALERVEALTTNPEIGWAFLELKAQVQYEAGKLDAAIKTQREYIEKIEDQDRIPAEERAKWKQKGQYVLSGYLVDANKVDEAATILKDLIKADPENPGSYNDLGFIWADHDMNMDEAEKLVRKALELDEKKRQKQLKDQEIDEVEAKTPNAAYLDSLGWVLYKQKKYEEAKKYLLQATKDEEDGNHIEIWDHLADVQLALGDSKGAIETWTKALKLDDVTKKDTERRKKVTEKLKKAKEAKK